MKNGGIKMKNRKIIVKELRSLIDEGDTAIQEGKVKTCASAEELIAEIIKLGEKKLRAN